MADHKIKIDFSDDSSRSGFGGGGGASGPENVPPMPGEENEGLVNKSAKKSIENAINDLGKSIEKITGVSMKGFSGSLAGAVISMKSIDKAADSFEDRITKAGKAVGNFFGHVKEFKDNVADSKLFMDKFSDALSDAVDISLSYKDNLKDMSKASADLTNILEKGVLKGDTAGSVKKFHQASMGIRGTSKLTRATSAAGGRGAAVTFAAAVGKLTLGVGIAVAAFTAISVVAVLVGVKLKKMIDTMTAAAANFSATLEVARAETEIQKIRDQLETSRRSGAELTQLQRDSSDYQSATRNLGRELIEFFAPFLSYTVKGITVILNAVAWFMKAINDGLDVFYLFASWIFDKLSLIPGISGYMSNISKWFKTFVDGQDDDEEDIFVNADVLNGLFSPANVFAKGRNDNKPDASMIPKGPNFNLGPRK